MAKYTRHMTAWFVGRLARQKAVGEI
ncbi:uncharacterized protein FFFS_15984 [Fusarium fujikuroi]|nr:uncharacterized protein FFFS_15984 [Fusarium fujikuroi]